MWNQIMREKRREGKRTEFQLVTSNTLGWERSRNGSIVVVAIIPLLLSRTDDEQRG